MRLNDKIAIIAHRGASCYAKENTLEAFKLAVLQKATAVEMDVRKTLDGELVVHHDRGMKNGRTTFWIDKHTYQELENYIGEGLLKLSDVLASLNCNTILNIDIKQRGIERDVACLINKFWRGDRVIVDSISPGSVITLRALLPNAQLGLSLAVEDKRDLGKRIPVRLLLALSPFLLRRLIGPVILRVARKSRCDIVNINARFVNKKTIELLHKAGIKVYVWRIDKEKQMRKLLQLGIDGIKTGKPDLLRRVVFEHENNC